jgi:hypothetical protein
MKLITFTPTRIISPATYLVEAGQNPYEGPEETTEERTKRLQLRGEHTKLSDTRGVLWARMRRIKEALITGTPISDYNVFRERPTDGYQYVDPGIYVNQEIIKVHGQSPLYKRYANYNTVLNRLSAVGSSASKAGSLAQRMQTRAAKKTLAAGASAAPTKTIPPDQVPRTITVGTQQVSNPYYTRLVGKKAFSHKLVKYAGSVYAFRHTGNYMVRNTMIVTKALERNGLKWNEGYGYGIYSNTADEDKNPGSASFVFVSNGDFAWLHKNSNYEMYNGKSKMAEQAFLTATPQVQDDFVQGKI